MVGGDRVGDVLQHHRLAGARRGDDQRPLSLADRRDQIDDPRGDVLDLRDFHHEPLLRIERREVVEVDAVPDFHRIGEVDAGDAQQRKVTLAVLRRADLALHSVAGPQPEPPHLARTDVDVVGPRQIVGFRRPQEAEPVLQHLEHAVAEDRHVVLGELLQNGEHHLLLAQGAGVLDPQFFRVRQQLGRRFGLEFLEIHRRLATPN